MLYVNLIEDRLQQRRLSDQVMVGGVVACLVLVLTAAGMVLWFKARVGGIERDITRINQMTHDIQETADEAGRLEKAIGILQPVKGVAEAVHSTQERWGLILSAVGEQLPAEAGLVEVSSSTDPATGGRRVKVRGEARNQEVVSDYMYRLNNFVVEGFQVFDPTRTALGDLNTQETGGVRISNFTVNLLVAGSEKPKIAATPASSATKGETKGKEGAK